MRQINLLLFVLFGAIMLQNFQVYAQQRRTDLEKEKKENLKKIQETNRFLEETRNQKSTNLGQLNIIKEQIRDRNKVIRTIQKEVRLIDQEINETESNISGLETDLVALKKEYALMIYTAQKTSNDQDKLVFLFSSQTFNQLIMRLKYFTYYSKARKTQVSQMKRLSHHLKQQRALLLSKRQEKHSLLGAEVIEQENLKSLENQQAEVVKVLSKKERELQEELEQRKKALAKLERLIRDLIRNEMAKTSHHKSLATPESHALSSSFSGNRGKLYWPVRQGFISQHFGKQRHSVLKNVVIENLGVDIQTNKDESVRAVFDGKVVAVASVPGMNEVVMIEHGAYYTFYAKLKNVQVQIGQKVKAKEDIGMVSTDQDEVSELQFQIWKGNEKLDPEDWLIDR